MSKLIQNSLYNFCKDDKMPTLCPFRKTDSTLLKGSCEAEFSSVVEVEFCYHCSWQQPNRIF